MGLATVSKQGVERTVYSADTFLTNWNRMSNEARQEMFGGIPGGYSQDITTLARNVEVLKNYARILPNNSNTAQVSIFAGELGTALGSLITGTLAGHPVIGASVAGAALSQAAGTHVISTALTNPETVKFLVRRTGQLAFQASDMVIRARAGTYYQGRMPEVTVNAERPPPAPNLTDVQSQLP
jgi:hypothetical protein